MSKQKFKTSIGGQALIEGVMMRGPEKSAMAVRLPNNEIDVEEWSNGTAAKAWYRKAPFVRGIFNMADSLVTGYKCLMRSATKSGLEDEAPTKFELWLAKTFGKSISSIVSIFAVVVGGLFAVLLFMVLPAFLVSLVSRFVVIHPIVKSLIEGLIKIVVFVLYLWLVSKLDDIKRVFMYHGAEHKTIACYEAGEELTVENVRPQTRFHPRCGTSFMLIVLVVSILVFSVVSWNNVIIRVLLKILMLPIVVGISYEIIKYAGRHSNPLTRIISAPGLLLQNLTTYEPTDDQIEVAIASMLPVIPAVKGEDRW